MPTIQEGVKHVVRDIMAFSMWWCLKKNPTLQLVFNSTNCKYGGVWKKIHFAVVFDSTNYRYSGAQWSLKKGFPLLFDINLQILFHCNFISFSIIDNVIFRAFKLVHF